MERSKITFLGGKKKLFGKEEFIVSKVPTAGQLDRYPGGGKALGK